METQILQITLGRDYRRDQMSQVIRKGVFGVNVNSIEPDTPVEI